MTPKLPRGQTPARRAYMRAYCAAHPPRDRRAYKAAYDAAHQEENAAYRARNRAKLKSAKAAYYRAHRDRLLAGVKARDKADPARVSAYHADHYERNAARIKATVAAYRKAHPEEKRTLENRRRARKAGNGGSHTLDERLAKFDLLGNICLYCGEPKPLTHDHKVPLSRGGTDNIENIVPSCRSCNSRKSNKTAHEFVYFGRTNHARQGGVGGSDKDASR